MANAKRGHVSPQEIQELYKMKKQASSMLGKSGIMINKKSGDQLVEQLDKFITTYRENINPADRLIDVAYGLGEYFADSIVKQYQWEYCTLTFEDGRKWFAVVSPDSKFAILIHNYIYNLLTEKDKTVNVLLLFNMLDEDILKQYETGEEFRLLS